MLWFMSLQYREQSETEMIHMAAHRWSSARTVAMMLLPLPSLGPPSLHLPQSLPVYPLLLHLCPLDALNLLHKVLDEGFACAE